MKNDKIIVTGTRGYIATHLKMWFEEKNDETEVALLDLHSSDWMNQSFENVRAIVHCAALVHKNEKKHDLEEYRKINTDLTLSLAQKAKAEGVKAFIFISTMAVYGTDSSCFKNVEIQHDTPLLPKTKYGKSKLEAEQCLQQLADDNFDIAIVRPPLVYGENCPGNFGLLKKLTLTFGVMPKLHNQKSMIYIDNLCECIYQIYIRGERGVFCPQNAERVSTVAMTQLIAKVGNKKMLLLPVGWLVKVASLIIYKLRACFGNEAYSMELSKFDFEYNVVSLEESVKRS